MPAVPAVLPPELGEVLQLPMAAAQWGGLRRFRFEGLEQTLVCAKKAKLILVYLKILKNV